MFQRAVGSMLQAIGNTSVVHLNHVVPTGMNVVGALDLAQELGPGQVVVTVASDSGLKIWQASSIARNPHILPDLGRFLPLDKPKQIE